MALPSENYREVVMLNNTRRSGNQRTSSDADEFNVSKLEATLCIGASALATIAVLAWAARTYFAAVL
jgi:hypothetical protein